MDRAALKLVDVSKLVRRPGKAARAGFPHGLGREGVHEVCARAYGDGPAAAGFALAAGRQAWAGGALAWITRARDARLEGALSGRGLADLGAAPGRTLYIEAPKAVDVLWAVEEAVTASAVACVVAECDGLDFTASRRLTLASQARGVAIILLLPWGREGATAAHARWRVSAQPSAPNRLDPRGLGRPRWAAALERSRTAPEAVGETYVTEFDHETLSLHMAGQLAPRQAPQIADAPAGTGLDQAGLSRAG
ncbi:MAG: hypothetical protein AAGH87_05955 [Pseudomonadota bacterium]